MARLTSSTQPRAAASASAASRAILSSMILLTTSARSQVVVLVRKPCQKTCVEEGGKGGPGVGRLKKCWGRVGAECGLLWAVGGGDGLADLGPKGRVRFHKAEPFRRGGGTTATQGREKAGVRADESGCVKKGVGGGGREKGERPREDTEAAQEHRVGGVCCICAHGGCVGALRLVEL